MPGYTAACSRRVTGEHTITKQHTLVDWLNDEFRDACLNDAARLDESLWILKVAFEKGDSPQDAIGMAIASFVQGLILGEQPITVPTENN